MGREPIVPLSPNPSSEQDFAAIPPSPSTLAPFPVAVGPRVLGSAHEGESAAVHASRLLPNAPRTLLLAPAGSFNRQLFAHSADSNRTSTVGGALRDRRAVGVGGAAPGHSACALSSARETE